MYGTECGSSCRVVWWKCSLGRFPHIGIVTVKRYKQSTPDGQLWHGLVWHSKNNTVIGALRVIANISRGNSWDSWDLGWRMHRGHKRQSCQYGRIQLCQSGGQSVPREVPQAVLKSNVYIYGAVFSWWLGSFLFKVTILKAFPSFPSRLSINYLTSTSHE